MRRPGISWINAVITLCALALISAGGCGDTEPLTLTQDELEKISITQQQIELLEAKGGLALVIGGETITSTEIIRWPLEFEDMSISALDRFKPVAQTYDLEEFKKIARKDLEDILITRITSVLIYQTARNQRGKQLDDALDKAADSELRKYIMRFEGNDAQADAALEAMKMTRKDFKEQRKRFILVQNYISEKMPTEVPVTLRQIRSEYERMKDDYFKVDSQLQFRLIDIQPMKMELQPQQDPLTEAKKMADKLVQRLRAGEDFAKLAEEYSHGHRSSFGGLWEPVSFNSLAPPYNVIANKARDLEPGEISEPVETLGHIFIVKLESKRAAGYQPLTEVQDEVRGRIIAERRRQASESVYDQLHEQAELGVKPKFVNFCLERIYELSNGKQDAAEAK